MTRPGPARVTRRGPDRGRGVPWLGRREGCPSVLEASEKTLNLDLDLFCSCQRRSITFHEWLIRSNPKSSPNSSDQDIQE